MRILIVEDDKELALTLSEILEQHQYETMICYNCKQAYNEIQKPYDCFLLDNRLPDGSGMELCSYIRQFSHDPIIFISSDTQETSILKGFALQADDYIEKPFRLKVLLAKIEAVLKRAGKYNEIYKLKDACLYKQHKKLVINEEEFELTITDTVILECLFKSYPRVVSRNEICSALFHNMGKVTSDATLNVRISELRRRLGVYGSRVESVRHVGYWWHV
ncbi:response regulator transcription factor [Floccifex sp.]|uniref:response regulator transcription factor n=1 Tax=Floccifex sp. TaxID=2815810 RepID=UPI002A7503BA|nr:response regulator transcription factor [Floccifex sp.]MDD7280666.1 response regulator transcription factor [Erysipelotrichaceae bacterium]MDY2958265.1 response regulator transcription factor [Floccifex sp.]